MTTLPYEIVDVFTDRPFAGNPLAVVHDGDVLGTDQMQRLAREFNLSETVFLLPPDADGAGYRARIFTPVQELPFAGHPSVGAAVVWSRRAGRGAGEVVQECGAGLLPIQVHDGQRATLTGGRPVLGAPVEAGPLLAAVGLAPDDAAGPPPRTAGCGLDFVYLAVRAGAVAGARLDPARAVAAGGGMLSVFAWDPDTAVAHARVFGPGCGVDEDPATGSAALGLGVWLVDAGWLPADGAGGYQVRQGAEIGRPSTLDCVATASGGAAVTVTVTGQVVPVARGEIAVPPFVG